MGALRMGALPPPRAIPLVQEPADQASVLVRFPIEGLELLNSPLDLLIAVRVLAEQVHGGLGVLGELRVLEVLLLVARVELDQVGTPFGRFFDAVANQVHQHFLVESGALVAQADMQPQAKIRGIPGCPGRRGRR
jgi:hypothetical protein